MGSLTVVGTGIQAGQMTMAAKAAIEQADKLLYFVTEPMAAAYLHQLNPNAESLEHLYGSDKERLVTYMQMVERMLEEARRGQDVCVAFYGHPGVFVVPAQEAIRQARAEGIAAKMLPGISAEDCLFADLGVDPGLPGCQSFEATDFLLHRRRFDVTSSLVIWQIGAIGVQTCRPRSQAPRNLDVLAEYLLPFYGPEHGVVIYEASVHPTFEHVAERTTVGALGQARVSTIATLYVPPKSEPRPVDAEMARRLGMSDEAVQSIRAKLEMKLAWIRAMAAE